MARARRPLRRPAAASCSPRVFWAVALARARRSALVSSRSASMAAVSARSASSEGRAPDRGQGLVASGGAARTQLETDRVRTLARRTGPVPHPAPGRSTGGEGSAFRWPRSVGLPWPTTRSRWGRTHCWAPRWCRPATWWCAVPWPRWPWPAVPRSARPPPRATAGRQLHQRGRVRHRPVQRDPAEPPPRD